MSEEKETKERPPMRVQFGYPPVITPLVIERELFEPIDNNYKMYRHLMKTDEKLAGGVHTAAVLASECLTGFTVKAGEKLEAPEEELLQELKKFEPFLLRRSYDIAFHLYVDGNAVYAIDENEAEGVRNLVYLPMTHLTCVEKEEQIMKLETALEKIKRKRLHLELLKPFMYKTQIFKRGIYILSELSDIAQQHKAENVVHFDWGRTEEVTDILGRYTLGVWNESPIHSLRAKILWKHALVINDMLLRDRMVPREEHILPGAAFDPNLFEGATQEERISKAKAAAEAYINEYADKVVATSVERRKRPDQGYVHFEGTEIRIIEPRLQYTSPNELVAQIESSIPAATGAAESAVTGTTERRGRASFASEIRIGAYMALKAEFAARRIADVFIELGKRHIKKIHKNKYDEHFNKISFKITKILEKHQMIRDAAILMELPFTDAEIREFLDKPPLTSQQMKEIDERRSTSYRRRVSPREAAAAARRAVSPRRPLTPASQEQQQVT